VSILAKFEENHEFEKEEIIRIIHQNIGAQKFN
jgi:hypothetical protein